MPSRVVTFTWEEWLYLWKMHQSRAVVTRGLGRDLVRYIFTGALDNPDPKRKRRIFGRKP